MTQSMHHAVILTAALAGTLLVGCGSEPEAEPSRPDTAQVGASEAADLLAQLPEDVRELVVASLAARGASGADVSAPVTDRRQLAQGGGVGADRRAGQRGARGTVQRGGRSAGQRADPRMSTPGWSSAAAQWPQAQQPLWPMAGADELDLEALFAQAGMAQQADADMQAWGEALAALAMLGYAGQDLTGWDSSAGWADLGAFGHGGTTAGWGDLGALGYSGGSPADPWLAGGQIDGNWLTGTAISTSGDSGYIALGDGGFVSW